MLTLPTTLTLNGSVSGSLTVDFSSDEPDQKNPVTLDTNGNYTLNMGGVLTIPTGTADGLYSNQFVVTANYQ